MVQIIKINTRRCFQNHRQGRRHVHKSKGPPKFLNRKDKISRKGAKPRQIAETYESFRFL